MGLIGSCPICQYNHVALGSKWPRYMCRNDLHCWGRYNAMFHGEKSKENTSVKNTKEKKVKNKYFVFY